MDNQPQTEEQTNPDNLSADDLAELQGFVVMGTAKRPLITSDNVADNVAADGAEPDVSMATELEPEIAQPTVTAVKPKNKKKRGKKKRKNKSSLHIHITIENPVVHINTLNIHTYEEEA